jgi:hypothetical protein
VKLGSPFLARALGIAATFLCRNNGDESGINLSVLLSGLFVAVVTVAGRNLVLQVLSDLSPQLHRCIIASRT